MKPITLSLVFVASLALNAPMAAADTLLVERVQVERAAALPIRGSTMNQVQARFGVPIQKYPAIHGPNDHKHNPPITRWSYPNFNVYFEYNHVVDAVVIRISPQEIGPAPVRN